MKRDIRDYILDNVSDHANDIASITAKAFSISRQSVIKHIKKLIEEGLIIGRGKTRGRHYELRDFVDESFHLKVTSDLEEDIVWRTAILPFMEKLSGNVVDICQYGFTEMLRNVIDHSQSKEVIFGITRNAVCIHLSVLDKGIGIFNKIQKDFGLHDPRHALLELSKGKLTSDPERHTGEGIFFTSRMFDEYSILSNPLFYGRRHKGDDWLLEVEERSFEKGTLVSMNISPKAIRTTQEVFQAYAPDKESYGFTRTHVPIELVRYEGEQLVSRSQAKRLLARFEHFSEVMLDFQGVTTIGQAFADEIFRVYANGHKNTSIRWLNGTPEVDKMIYRAISNGETKPT